MVGFVTGVGTGYNGYMVLALLDESEKAVGLDNLPTGFRWVAPEGIPLVIGDVGDTALVDQIFTAKIVVPRSIQTLFGICQDRVSRLRVCDCFEQPAAKVPNRLPLLLTGYDHKSVRNCVALVAIGSRQEIRQARLRSRLGPDPISVFIDGTHRRAARGYHSRRFEIALARIETRDRKPRHFASGPSKGLSISSTGAESLVNVLVNACSKLQVMRGPSIDLRRVLQARGVVIVGRLRATSLDLVA